MASSPSILSQPLVSFGSEVCSDLEAGLRREWLVTNGLGGYASGTLAGPPTRSYHGLLVASLAPPVERTVLVGGMVEWATFDGTRYALSANEYADGTIDPRGFINMAAFALDGMLPAWTFALGDAEIERRIWMAQGQNTTYIAYRVTRANGPVNLTLTPLVTYRSFHALTSGQGWAPQVQPVSGGARIVAWDGAQPFRILADGADFKPDGTWFWNMHYRAETERGLNDKGDLYAIGDFTAQLAPGASLTLVLTTEDATPVREGGLRGGTPFGAVSTARPPDALTAVQDRQRELLRPARAEDADPTVQQLVLAADQFLVECVRGEVRGTTIIAGYHWFNDWGRDTMIALPGLTLATGRASEAENILRTFARFINQGMLPNSFPDGSGTPPEYNTVDATLWYVLAIRAYVEATGNRQIVDDLLPQLKDIVAWHQRGTRYHIKVDPADGLLYAGEPGVQLTWMDARVGDWVVTPRIGKPVEINALWYNVLRALEAWLRDRHDSEADSYGAAAQKALASFRARFWLADRGYLADVIDGPNGDDVSLRPNQIFALSLPHQLIEGDQAHSVLTAVGDALHVSIALRSLSPRDPNYQGTYGSDQRHRDGAYHQGTAWTWLIGPYATAYARVAGDREAALELLRPIVHHLHDAGLGTISEILDGDPPHHPRGCISQAWSVGEALRAWRALTDGDASESASP